MAQASDSIQALEGKAFMDYHRLISFIVNIQMLRDEAIGYYESEMSGLFPNIYTEKFCDIIRRYVSLVDVLQTELSARSHQLGVDEGTYKVLPKYAKKKKVKRKTAKRARATRKVED